MTEDLTKSNDHKDTLEKKAVKTEMQEWEAGGHQRKFRALIQGKKI